MSDDQLVMLSGLLDAGRRITLSPLFPTDRQREGVTLRQGHADTLDVEFLDGDGNRLGTAIVPTEPVCEYREQAPFSEQPRTFATPVVLPLGTRAIRMRSPAGDEILTVEVAERPPDLELDWEPPEDEVEGIATLAWQASHPDGRQVSLLVSYWHDGGPWRTLSLPESSDSIAVDFDELPGGEECRLRVAASDGVNLTIRETEPFAVTRKGVRPTIISVDPTPPLVEGEVQVLRGQGYDLERNTFVSEELRWVSSLDGELGSGRVITTQLSPGVHEISLHVGGRGTAARAETPDQAAVIALQVVPVDS